MYKTYVIRFLNGKYLKTPYHNHKLFFNEKSVHIALKELRNNGHKVTFERII